MTDIVIAAIYALFSQIASAKYAFAMTKRDCHREQSAAIYVLVSQIALQKSVLS
jgi:hypothetical protein